MVHFRPVYFVDSKIDNVDQCGTCGGGTTTQKLVFE